MEVRDVKRVVLVLLVTAMVVITFGVALGFLGVPLVFPCSDDERAVFNEFPHYGTVEPGVRPDTEIGGCAVFYDTDDYQGRVAEYYVGHLKAHG